MAFLRCYMCKNACGIIATVEGKTVRVVLNRNHPQPGICGRGAAALSFRLITTLVFITRVTTFQ